MRPNLSPPLRRRQQYPPLQAWYRSAIPSYLVSCSTFASQDRTTVLSAQGDVLRGKQDTLGYLDANAALTSATVASLIVLPGRSTTYGSPGAREVLRAADTVTFTMFSHNDTERVYVRRGAKRPSTLTPEYWQNSIHNWGDSTNMDP